MKHLLAAATFAALLAAVPASAQTVYGSPVGQGVVVVTGVDGGPDVYWKQNFVINSAVDGVANGAGAAAVPGADFDVWATSPQNSALGSVEGAAPANAVAPVPEPATWAMMLMGFVAVGRALRGRRKATLRFA